MDQTHHCRSKETEQALRPTRRCHSPTGHGDGGWAPTEVSLIRRLPSPHSSGQLLRGRIT